METVITLTERLNARQNEYRYLLLDPLKTLPDWYSFSPERLYQHQASDSLRRVLRPDLAWSPDHCPLLLLLASPDEQCNEALVQESESYAWGEALHGKRYVCGWLSSALKPDAMAAWLAELCRNIKPGAIIPAFEPLRMELHKASADPELLSDLIHPVSEWHVLSSGGRLITLTGERTGKAWHMTWVMEVAQNDARDILRLVCAWKKSITTLPEDAARLAIDAWMFAGEQGLHHLNDKLYLAANLLTLPGDFTEHAAVQTLLQEAKGNPMLRFKHLMQALPDAVWQELSHA